MKIQFNPQYGIRNEKTCSYICLVDSSMQASIDDLPSYMFIPPLYGYIFSKCQGDEIEDICESISVETGIRSSSITHLITQLVDNPKSFKVNCQNSSFVLPPRVLLSVPSTKEGINCQIKNYVSDDFNPLNQYAPLRPCMPISVSVIVTTKCGTNCIYCYADRDKKIDLDLQKLLDILKECHQKGVMNFSISGGDIFAFPYWKTIIQKMAEYQYFPFLSTKIPLTTEDVYFLHANGIRELQFSLDSVIADELKTIIKVKKDYLQQVDAMLQACRSCGLKIQIRTVLTQYNTTLASISALYSYIKSFDNIYIWSVVHAFYSIYKGAYEDYQAPKSALQEINAYLNKIKHKAPFLLLNRILEDHISKPAKYEAISDFLTYNKACPITSYSMNINIHGKVMLCEMFYNNEKFHWGDVNYQTIEEIWNSSSMLGFHSFKLPNLINNAESVCNDCDNFNSCKVGSCKKVCIYDIVKVYGDDKWDYPDPRCPKAPPCNLDLLTN